METLSKQRAPCSVGAAEVSAVRWPWWPRPSRSRVALPGVRPVAVVSRGYLGSDPLWCTVLFVLVLPSDVSHLCVGIFLFRFVVRTFVRSTWSLGSVPWSSPPSPLWFLLTLVQRDLCFYVFLEREEQSWALLVCADETCRVFTLPCLRRLKVLRAVPNPALSSDTVSLPLQLWWVEVTAERAADVEPASCFPQTFYSLFSYLSEFFFSQLFFFFPPKNCLFLWCPTNSRNHICDAIEEMLLENGESCSGAIGFFAIFRS